jgi:predicted ATPase/DNA-binding SARP family transcriptional activator
MGAASEQAEFDLRACLFGALRVIAPDGGTVALSAPPKVLPLLAHLLVLRDAPIARVTLARRLWEDEIDENKLLPNLRRHLYYLERILPALPMGERWLARTGGAIALEPRRRIQTDYGEFERALALGRREEADAFYVAPLLVQLQYPWLAAERERLQRLAVSNLAELVRASKSGGNTRKALVFAERLIKLEPLREDAVRDVIHLRAECGDVAGAQELWRDFARRLRDELGVPPMEETLQLRRRIAGERSTPQIGYVPSETSSFFGRERELALVSSALREGRVVTLTGPPGVGKSRVAVHTAAAIQSEFCDGAWFVDLARVDDPAAVERATLQVFREQSGHSDSIDKRLADKQALLVLDNCEHLIAACSRLILRAMRESPDLRVLVTTRQRLNLEGEHIVPIVPFAIGDAVVVEEPAVRLFIDRARAVSPVFELGPGADETVARICRTLDGLPLAIELAADRLATLTLGELAARLEELAGSPRRPQLAQNRRWATMHDAFAWSCVLLEPEQRNLYTRLAVFAGSWTLADAAAVCAEGSPRRSLNRFLSELVDASLVMEERHRSGRYRLLETARRFALFLLQASASYEDVRARHAAHYVGIAERLDAASVYAKYPDLEAALAYTVGEGRDANLGLRLSVALSVFWQRQGLWNEGIKWLSAALENPAEAPPQTRAMALTSLATLLCRRGGLAEARARCEAALAVLSGTGDGADTANALHGLADLERRLSRLHEAQRLCTSALDIHRKFSNFVGVAQCTNLLGVIALSKGDFVKAKSLLRESREQFESIGDDHGVAIATGHLGHGELLAGENEPEQMLMLALRLGRETGDRGFVASMLQALADAALLRDDLSAAIQLAAESLGAAVEFDDLEGITRCVEIAAAIAGRARQSNVAVKLWLAAEAARTSFGLRPTPSEAALRDRKRRWAMPEKSPDQGIVPAWPLPLAARRARELLSSL